jgi:hypothetical protein
VQKYEAAATENNYLFRPIIFEANGFIHPHSLALLKDFAELASSRFNRSESAVLSYFRNQLSMALQISLARSIQRHSIELLTPTRTAQDHHQDYCIDRSYILSIF